VKFGHAFFETRERTDKQTDRHKDTLIAKLWPIQGWDEVTKPEKTDSLEKYEQTHNSNSRVWNWLKNYTRHR